MEPCVPTSDNSTKEARVHLGANATALLELLAVELDACGKQYGASEIRKIMGTVRQWATCD